MGGGSGGSTTQTSEPWRGQQPYLTDLYNQASRQFHQGPQQYYPGSTVAGFSPQTDSALHNMYTRGSMGSTGERAANDYVSSMLRQPGIDPSAAVGGAQQMIGGIGTSQGMLSQYARNPYEASALGMPGGGQFGNTLANQRSSLDAGPGFASTLAQAQQHGGLDGARAFAGNAAPGAMDASVNYVNNLLGSQGSMLPGAATDQLSQTASGDFLGGNPYLDDMFNTAANRVTEQFNSSVMPGINATFGAAGRTGSGIHGETVGRAAGELGQNLSGLAANIYAPAYEAERGRQMQAAGQLGSLGLGEGQQRLQAAGLGGDLFSAQNAADLGRLGLASNLHLGQQGQGLQAAGMGLGALESGMQRELQGAGMGLGFLEGGLDRSMGAAGMLGQQGLGGIGALGGLYGQQGALQQGAAGLVPAMSGLDYQNLGAMLGAGGARDQMSQAMLDDQVARWNFQQGAPAQSLQNYANLIYGSPSFATTQTDENIRGNRMAGALGGALGGFEMFGPWGALGGGILGALGS